MKALLVVILGLVAATSLFAKPRARDLGIPFDGAPGPLNAITDVVGVEVGHATLIRGRGLLRPGRGPVRTGVSAVFPRGKASGPVFAGWFSLNGNGEMTGTAWLEESGLLDGPVMITNTHSVGAVRDAVVGWRAKRGIALDPISLPVVAETWDAYLNDINGFHVKAEHAWEAMDSARGGPVTEGNVGGGTGMICFELKCGIGTASRKVKILGKEYTVGTLVQGNFGLRPQLRIAGIPVGKEIPSPLVWNKETGSIIVVVATDAPLLPHQLKRVARRSSLGIARLGSVSGDGSGDIFVAFSTANASAAAQSKTASTVEMLPNGEIDPLFEATVETVEESVVNAMIAAETMTGADNHVVHAIPVGKLQEILRKHGRLNAPVPAG